MASRSSQEIRFCLDLLLTSCIPSYAHIKAPGQLGAYRYLELPTGQDPQAISLASRFYMYQLYSYTIFRAYVYTSFSVVNVADAAPYIDWLTLFTPRQV
jgi:hypothetical protein